MCESYLQNCLHTFPANWTRRRIYNNVCIKTLKLHRISKKKNSKTFFFKGKYFITCLQIFIYKYVHPIQQRVNFTLIISNDFPARTEIIILILNVGPFYRHIFITNLKVNWKCFRSTVSNSLIIFICIVLQIFWEC